MHTHGKGTRRYSVCNIIAIILCRIIAITVKCVSANMQIDTNAHDTSVSVFLVGLQLGSTWLQLLHLKSQANKLFRTNLSTGLDAHRNLHVYENCACVYIYIYIHVYAPYVYIYMFIFMYIFVYESLCLDVCVN